MNHDQDFDGPDAEADGRLSTGDGADAAEAAPSVPGKFRDPDTGDVNIPALVQSYKALEQKLGRGEHLAEEPDDEEAGNYDADFGDTYDDEFEAAEFLDDIEGDGDERNLDEYDDGFDDLDADPANDSIPVSPEEYQIESGHDWVANDPEVNDLLHAAGFTQAQAQLVYDLAAEKVVPLIQELLQETGVTAGQSRLAEHLGGTAALESSAAEIDAWGRANLPDGLYQTLVSTPDGVLAMRHMMQHGEPRFLDGGAGGGGPDEAALRKLMDDPRYWRDHEPALVKQVQDGFRRLYPD